MSLPPSQPSGSVPPDSERAYIPEHKRYAGPAPGVVPPMRTKSNAQMYFERYRSTHVISPRVQKGLGIGGWVLGGFAGVFMLLFVDFGEKEHVFRPLRKELAAMKDSFFTLSSEERRTMGMDSPTPTGPKKPEDRPSERI